MKLNKYCTKTDTNTGSHWVLLRLYWYLCQSFCFVVGQCECTIKQNINQTRITWCNDFMHVNNGCNIFPDILFVWLERVTHRNFLKYLIMKALGKVTITSELLWQLYLRSDKKRPLDFSACLHQFHVWPSSFRLLVLLSFSCELFWHHTLLVLTSLSSDVNRHTTFRFSEMIRCVYTREWEYPLPVGSISILMPITFTAWVCLWAPSKPVNDNISQLLYPGDFFIKDNSKTY